MKVSKSWLKELVTLSVPIEEVEKLLPIRTIAIREFAPDYFELDMKGYNRPDLLSMRGVATEVAAITGSKTTFEEESFQLAPDNGVQIIVDNEKLVPLYCIAKIEGLKVEKSSPEWIKKLAESGMRSINNVTDVTNLIMLEYGQPLHSFDAAMVKDQTIIVRSAKNGEELVTLDHKTRRLSIDDLLITDPDKALGVAGVMGGLNSEINEQTTSILLEAAIFDPITIRKTAQRLNLPSEASKRFQHGLTKTRLLQALQAAVKMYQSLGGKLTALTIVGETTDQTKVIELREDKLNSLVGINIDPEFSKSSLKKLQFSTDKINNGWAVTPPYFRLDIENEADLIEEVARMYGYENIPAKPLQGELPTKVDQSLFELIAGLKTELVKLGLTEIQTYSFYSTAVLNNLEADRENLIRIANPMSAETEYMRDLLWPNLLERTIGNLKYREDVAVFEVGKVYHPQKEKLPEEGYHLSIALSNNTDNPVVELNTITVKLAESLGWKLQAQEDEADSDLIHPTRHFSLFDGDHQIGVMAEVHPRVINRFGSEKRVAILEISLRTSD